MDRTAIRRKKEDAKILDPELKDCYENHLVLLNLLISAKQRVIADKSGNFSRAHGIPSPDDKRKDVFRKKIESYFDKLRNQVIDNAFVEMVATFERIVFTKIDNATGLTRKIVREHYERGNPFHIAIISFIKSSDEINRLSSLYNILHGRIPNDLSDRFEEIISYRNRVTHGRRFGEDTYLTLQDVSETLDKILKIIG